MSRLYILYIKLPGIICYTYIVWYLFLLVCIIFSYSCLLLSYIDLYSFLTSFNLNSEVNWSFDYSSNFDPVRDAAAQNAAESTNNGSYQHPGGSNPPVEGTRQDTDTKRLGDYLSECGRGNSTYNCGLENNHQGSPLKVFLSRIWAHVKVEHPEWAPAEPITDEGTGITTIVRHGIVSDSLINNIYNLNKNYPGNWPR